MQNTVAKSEVSVTQHAPQVVGEQVVCKFGDIDRNSHVGEVGHITGSARLSSYHAREAMVKFSDGSSAWFWCTSLDSAALSKAVIQ